MQSTNKNKEFYLDHIFETNEGAYTKQAELLQDILKYFQIIEIDNFNGNQGNVVNNNDGKWISLQTEPQVFKIKELENWLMKHNRYFIGLYSGSESKIRMNVRIYRHDKQVKSHLKNLESIQLIHIKKYVKGEKNELKTPIYELTIHGLIILIIIRYQSNYFSQDKNRTNQIIIGYIQNIFRIYNSYICDFLIDLYNEIYGKGYSQLFIDIFIEVLHKNINKIKTIEDALNITLRFLLMNEKTHVIFNKIYVNTINKFEDKIKKIILYHEKAEIESRIHLSQPPKDWENLWIENLQNYSKLTLYSKCNTCHEKYPVLIDYFYYINNILPSNFLTIKCIKCNSDNSLTVSSDLSNKCKM